MRRRRRPRAGTVEERTTARGRRHRTTAPSSAAAPGRSTRCRSRRPSRERHARGRRRGRRPPAVPLGLRRRRLRDPDRLDGVRLLRRRPGRLARGRGPAASSRSARTRCSPGRWSSRRTSTVAVEVLPATPRRRAVVRRPPPRRAAAGCARRGPPRRRPGPPRPPARRAVHRPAGGQVRPAGRRLARHAARARPTSGSPPRRDRGAADPRPRRHRRRRPRAARRAHRAHRRDRRGQDDGASPAWPAARRPGRRRAWCAPGRPRRGRGPAAGRRRRRRPCSQRVDDAGAELDDGVLVLARTVVGRGPLAGRFLGGRACRRRCSPSSPTTCVAVHGQTDQQRLLRAGAAARARSTASPAPRCAEPLAAYRAAYDRLRERRARARRDHRSHARERAQEADLLRHGLDEIEAVAPEPGEDEALGAEAERLGVRRRSCAPPPPRRTTALARRPATRATTPTRCRRCRCPARARRAARSTTPRSAQLADRLAEAAAAGRRRGRRAGRLRRRPRRRPGAARRGAGPARRAHRAHPQVRRDRSTRCSPGPSAPRVACSSSTPTTSGSTR